MNLVQARDNMIEQQLRAWEVLDEDVLNALTSVPRERFVPARYKNLAFADFGIPLTHGQTMMAPKVEGRMLQALGIRFGDRILEIGTGTGFVTACLARLGGQVESVDFFDDLIEDAKMQLAALEIRNVNVGVGDAASGWLSDERYDVIAVTGSVPEYRPVFEQQLAIGGRLFVIVGERPVMSAMRVTRTGEHEFSRKKLFETELPALLNTSRKSPFIF
ncbi:MAG: protein-L-isoaspartate O-methyltransferase [Gammaproteobacteria bacterium]|nr:protein-L-isoaspartate O-methyltransferase [Gammaproteobacteria bacterium]